MTVVIFDASCLVPALVPEEGSRQSEQILDQAAEWVVNPLTVAEVRIALVRKAHRKVLTWAEVDMALAHFEDLLGRGFFRVEGLVPADFDRAPEAARRVPGLRTLDALHLVVALRLGVPMATYDAGLAQALTIFGHPVVTEHI